ncbi:MAG: hypothetical protein M1833_001309 [Piccolia ochrophora]|nr:MAG: hypothetical protein M1833_001309 [Piccolia ochrophora]
MKNDKVKYNVTNAEYDAHCETKWEEVESLRARYPDKYKEKKDWWSEEQLVEYRRKKAATQREIRAREKARKPKKEKVEPSAEVLEARWLAGIARVNKYRAKKKAEKLTAQE